MKSTRTFWLCACAGLLLPAASARAEQIIWSEQIVVTPSVVWGQAESGPTPPGRGGIRLKGDAHWHKVVGTTDLVAASLRSFTEGHPDTVYQFQDAPYSVTLLIRDKQSGL